MSKRIGKLIVLILCVSFIAPVKAQSWSERRALFNSSYNYEIEPVGVGQDGTKVFKVWGYGKDVGKAVLNAKQAGVAACIFKGLPGGGGGAPTPAICTDPDADEKHKDFFEKFFEVGGKHLQFIMVTNDASPAGKDRIKMKKGYKVAIYVQVMYNDLRKYLEEKGVAQSLDAGF